VVCEHDVPTILFEEWEGIRMNEARLLFFSNTQLGNGNFNGQDITNSYFFFTINI
jgi:hypothetical protein